MYFSDYDKYVETHEFVVSLKIKEKEFNSYLHWFLRNCSSKLQRNIEKGR